VNVYISYSILLIIKINIFFCKFVGINKTILIYYNNNDIIIIIIILDLLYNKDKNKTKKINNI